MATANQSQKLCLYESASGLKCEVHAQSDKCVVSYPQPVEFSGSVNIGDLVDIETIIDSLVADDATNAAAIVSQNTALSASVATVASNLTSESAARTAADTAEATARVNGDAALAADVAQEVADRAAAVTAEASARSSAVSAEASARQSADDANAAAIVVQKDRIDAMLAGSDVSLDTLAELVAAYEAVDTNTLATISSLTSALNVLTARVDELTGN